jgi:hypothetical protein
VIKVLKILDLAGEGLTEFRALTRLLGGQLPDCIAVSGQGCRSTKI